MAQKLLKETMWKKTKEKKNMVYSTTAHWRVN